MKAIIRAATALLVLLVLIAAILVFRTLTYESPAASHAETALIPPPQTDLQQAAQHLSEAIGFRTITEQDSATSKLSEWGHLHEWLARTYPRLHATLKRETVAGHTLISIWPGTDPSLKPFVLMAHQDVVPVVDSSEGDWKYPPFDGVIAENAVWGRGSIDDKGSMIAIFESIEALIQTGFEPRRTLIVVNGHDEEGAHDGATATAAWFREKGIVAEFVLDEGLLTITDFPLLKNRVGLIGIAEKGYATLRLTARGPGGHSSMPPNQTAVETLARALVGVTGNPAPMEINGPGAQTLRVLAPHAPFLTRMAIANEWLFKPLLVAQVTEEAVAGIFAHRRPSKVARYQARFAGVFFPAETMVTSYWQDGKTILIESKSKERGTAVISNAAITVR